MNAIFTAAREMQDFCRARSWRFCVIGGLAVQRWRELLPLPEIEDDPGTEERLRALLRATP